MAAPRASRKASKTKGRNSTKFNVGVKALIRALAAAEETAILAVHVGEKRLAAAKEKGDKKIIDFNKENLEGAKSAKAELKVALQRLEAIDCLDQFMNCDPEYL